MSSLKIWPLKVSLTTAAFSFGGFPSNTKTGLISCSRKVSVRKKRPVRGLERKKECQHTNKPKDRNPCRLLKGWRLSGRF